MNREMHKRIKRRWGLAVSLVLFVFAVLLAGLLMAGLLVMMLHSTGVLPLWDVARPEQAVSGVFRAILAMMGFSAFLGTAIAAFYSKKALNPIRKVVEATNRVAQGDFSVRVDVKGICELEELSRSFNKMAHELASIETLRGDFVNDFSHEFKTPIVSVRGFAKLLKDGDLSGEERLEYLDIIIAEAERLAALSTNVLDLTRYENIEIMSDKKPFRLDEQIRRAIVMTEPKWAAKDISVDVALHEVVFESREDVTQQIWLNLLDNAIKFTDKGGTIVIRLDVWNGCIRFRIQDDGIGMDEKTKARAFDKFYQGDASRSHAGNGLGLPITKRIVELCGGTIALSSEPGKGAAFLITLPFGERII